MQQRAERERRERKAQVRASFRELKLGELTPEILEAKRVGDVAVRDWFEYYRPRFFRKLMNLLWNAPTTREAYYFFLRDRYDEETYEQAASRRIREIKKSYKKMRETLKSLARGLTSPGELRDVFMKEIDLAVADKNRKWGMKLVYELTALDYLTRMGEFGKLEDLRFMDLPIFAVDRDGRIRTDLMRDWLLRKRTTRDPRTGKTRSTTPPREWDRAFKAGRVMSLSHILKITRGRDLPADARQLSLFDDIPRKTDPLGRAA
jgi:hypothetical protein